MTATARQAALLARLLKVTGRMLERQALENGFAAADIEAALEAGTVKRTGAEFGNARLRYLAAV
jgi:hypothetical protein